jgi:hypothetical protein
MILSPALMHHVGANALPLFSRKITQSIILNTRALVLHLSGYYRWFYVCLTHTGDLAGDDYDSTV